MTDSPWYVEAFRGDYREVYSHRDPEAARREVDWLLSLGLEGRLLDLCCGFGRHSVALARAGRTVFGLDLSADLLGGARELESAELLAGRLMRGDARQLPFLEASFGGVLNLFSSFGYFGDSGDEAVACEIARVLVPGGLAVFDLMNPERIRSRLVPESEKEQNGIRILERRSLEEGGRRVVKEVRLELPGGRSRAWREDVRLYEPAEIRALLARVSLEPIRSFGGFSDTPFGPDAERQLVVARRL